MEQTFITGLAIGLFVGWLIEFLIDIFYWRHGNSASGIRSKQLLDANLSLATANQHISILDSELVELSTHNSALNAALSESRREIENLRAQLAAIAARERVEVANEQSETELATPSADQAFFTAAQTTQAEQDLDEYITAAANVST